MLPESRKNALEFAWKQSLEESSLISKTSYQIADFELEKQKITQNLLETLTLVASF